MTDYSERIPAAIAKAEAGVAIHEKTVCAGHDNSCVGCVQDAALGLLAPEMAKALWHEMSRAMDRMNGTERAAFIAGFRGATIRYFTEKLEAISHD